MTHFALTSTAQTLSLLHRDKDGWSPVGTADAAAPDFAETLAGLRARAQALDGQPFRTRVVVPNDLICYLALTDVSNKQSRDTLVREALAKATPYAVEDLVYDWSEAGRSVFVAAVARTTLRDAEEFATDHDLAPACFVASPEAGRFVGEPFFGPSDWARDNLPADQMPNRLPAPVRAGVAAPDPTSAPPLPAPAPAAVQASDPAPAATPAPTPPAADQVQAATPATAAPTPKPAVKITATISRPAPAATAAPARSDDHSDDSGPARPPESAAPAEPGPAAASGKPAPVRFAAINRAAVDKPSAPSKDPEPAKSPAQAARPDAMQPPPGNRPATPSGKIPQWRKPALIAAALTAAAAIGWAAIGLVGDSPAPETPTPVVEIRETAPAPEQTAAATPDTTTANAPDPAATAAVTAEALPTPAQPVLHATPDVPVPDPEVARVSLSAPSASGRPDPVVVTGAARDPGAPPQSLPADGALSFRAGSPPVSPPPRPGTEAPETGAATQLPEAPESPASDTPAAGAETGNVIAPSPSGVVVIAGRPPVVPPVDSRPGQAAPEPPAAPETQAVPAERTSPAGPRPQLRPATISNRSETSTDRSTADRDGAAVASLRRPATRPASVQRSVTPLPQTAVVEEATPVAATPEPAVTYRRVLKPQSRPRSVQRAAERVLASVNTAPDTSARSSAATREDSSSSPSKVRVRSNEVMRPKSSTPSHVAKQATDKNALKFQKVNLIGVSGTPKNRVALVLLSNGTYQKVKVGDRLDGGQVSAIGDNELRYTRKGRSIVLKMPKG